jgi:hypothetical protein
MIFNSMKDIATYVNACPEVIECKKAYEEDQPGAFDEIEDALVLEIVDFEGRPEYGTDWTEWLDDNIGEMLDEAVSIVM